MPNRVIKDSVRQSRQIDSLTWFQEVVFYRLIVTVDDYGRYYANPQIIKSELFPTKEDLAKKDVATALDKLEEVGLISRYIFEGEQYLEFTKWNKHQQRRATKSKFPDANGNHLISIDINCNQMISDDNKCEQMIANDSNGNHLHPYSNTKSNTNTVTIARAREGRPEDDLTLSDDQVQKIQKDHSEVVDRMEYIGFEMSQATIDSVIDLYAQHGKETLLAAMEECKGVNGNKLRYLKKVLANIGTPKQEEGKQYMSDEEERQIMSSLVFGDEEEL